MRKNLFILYAILVSFSAKPLIACSCGGWDPFLKAMNRADIVALIKVEKYLEFIDIYNSPIPYSMEVSILNVLSGQESKEKIIIWGSNGMDCAPYLSEFKKGSTWLFAAKYIDNVDRWHIPNAKVGDYFIGGCGDYYLEVIDENVYGYIFEVDNYFPPNTQTYPLQKLMQIITHSLTLVDDSSTNLSDFKLYQNYPNPFNPNTTIVYNIASSSHVSIQVFNSLGEQVKTICNEYKSEGTYSEIFNADNLQSGVYIYRLFIDNNLIESKKMILLK